MLLTCDHSVQSPRILIQSELLPSCIVSYLMELAIFLRVHGVSDYRQDYYKVINYCFDHHIVREDLGGSVCPHATVTVRWLIEHDHKLYFLVNIQETELI